MKASSILLSLLALAPQVMAEKTGMKKVGKFLDTEDSQTAPTHTAVQKAAQGLRKSVTEIHDGNETKPVQVRAHTSTGAERAASFSKTAFEEETDTLGIRKNCKEPKCNAVWCGHIGDIMSGELFQSIVNKSSVAVGDWCHESYTAERKGEPNTEITYKRWSRQFKGYDLQDICRSCKQITFFKGKQPPTMMRSTPQVATHAICQTPVTVAGLMFCNDPNFRDMLKGNSEKAAVEATAEAALRAEFPDFVKEALAYRKQVGSGKPKASKSAAPEVNTPQGVLDELALVQGARLGNNGKLCAWIFGGGKSKVWALKKFDSAEDENKLYDIMTDETTIKGECE